MLPQSNAREPQPEEGAKPPASLEVVATWDVVEIDMLNHNVHIWSPNYADARCNSTYQRVIKMLRYEFNARTVSGSFEETWKPRKVEWMKPNVSTVFFT